jgi:hypothetical protein
MVRDDQRERPLERHPPLSAQQWAEFRQIIDSTRHGGGDNPRLGLMSWGLARAGNERCPRMLDRGGVVADE